MRYVFLFTLFIAVLLSCETKEASQDQLAIFRAETARITKCEKKVEIEVIAAQKTRGCNSALNNRWKATCDGVKYYCQRNRGLVQYQLTECEEKKSENQ
jgi:hypothetical protein